MDKRDKFIAELRDEARKKGVPFRAERWRGKGGHMMVFVGDSIGLIFAPFYEKGLKPGPYFALLAVIMTATALVFIPISRRFER